MKAIQVLQGIKRSIGAKGYVDFNVYDKAENVHGNPDSTRYLFNDGSILSFMHTSKLYVAWSIYENLRGQGETFQA
jgi:hypothetical protein